MNQLIILQLLKCTISLLDLQTFIIINFIIVPVFGLSYITFELPLITSIFTTMKNYSSVRTVETVLPQTNLNKESPPRVGLPLRLPSPQSNFRTKQSASRSREKDKEQESTQLLLTERTAGAADFLGARETKGSNIKSYLRIRPSTTSSPLLQLHNQQTIVYQRSSYKFDCIFEAGAPQEQVYVVAGRDVANTFLEGYNATIFAYGSTGSGKTYTMFGNDDGLVPSVVRQIFAKVEAGARLSCSMIEIYRENLIDLLSVGGPQLKIKDAGNSSCVVHNLSTHPITNEADALALIKRGNILKKIRQTDLNESSSRSHVVFTLHLERIDGRGRTISCRFNLVDLAGSEKVCKSKVQGEGLQEAKKINLSLSCLGNTISALVKNSDHVPYRQSKLTRILKQSLMGSSVTRLIVTCSLADDNIEETLSSMKFAQRAQKVQTQAEIAYHVSRCKDEKEERLRCVQAALDRLQADTGKITFLLNRQPCECNNCAQIKLLLSRKPSLPVFNFHPLPLPAYKSPKQTDSKGYFSNTSVEKSKNFSLIKTNYQSWNERSSDREAFNRKFYDLKSENQKLKDEKQRLEVRLRTLQEKMMIGNQKEKQKGNAKKIIKLGERPSKMNKQNQMGMANIIQKVKIQKKYQDIKRENAQYLPIQVESEPSCIKEHDCQQTLQLIQEVVSKLESACYEYRNAVYPIHLNILNQQLANLQGTLHTTLASSYLDPIRISGILINLQKKICSYVDSVGDIVPRLLEGSNCENRLELSEVLKEKLQEVSDIKWNFKQFYEEPDDLQAISDLLRPLTNRLPEKEVNNCHMSRISMLSGGENEFLSLNPATFQPILQQNLLRVL